MANWITEITEDYENLPADKKKLKYPPPEQRRNAPDVPLFSAFFNLKTEVEPNFKRVLKAMQDGVHRFRQVEGMEEMADQLQSLINYNKDMWNAFHEVQEYDVKPQYEEFQAARRPNRKKGEP